MDTLVKYDNVYEVEFEQLVEGEKVPINATKQIMEAQLDITVSIGSANEKLEKIANLKVGDLIILDKLLDQPLDISANERVIASGESMILDNKLAVRLSKIRMEDVGM